MSVSHAKASPEDFSYCRRPAWHSVSESKIVEGTKLLGIITDRDIRLNLPSPATSLSVWEINYLLARMTVDSAMTKSVVTVGPHRDAKQAAALMLEHRIGALPVVDGGQLIGIITETDLLRAFVKSC